MGEDPLWWTGTPSLWVLSGNNDRSGKRAWRGSIYITLCIFAFVAQMYTPLTDQNKNKTLTL
jgi:hypothetical protein